MDIKDFLPELRKMIQGPLQTAMVDELLTSAINFCKEAKIIRQTANVQSKEAGEEMAIVSADPALVPWGVVSVYSDGNKLNRGTDYLQDSRAKITFIKKFDNLTVNFWCYPTDKAQLPDELSGYATSICSGAASKLFLQPRRQWFSAELSNFHKREFVEGYRKAWREVESDEFGEFQNPNVTVSFWI
jgi:hypothetical protein